MASSTSSTTVSSALGCGRCCRFAGKVVVISGGSTGMGKGAAVTFVNNGAKVVFCTHKESEGKSVELELNGIGGTGEATFILCDVTREDQIKSLVEQTIKKYGQIDCLINNVGWHPPYQTIDETTSQQFKDLFNLNVMSYFLFSKFCLPHIRRNQGSIINNASMVAHFGQGSAIPYVATKGAIIAMTRAMAIDEAKYLVRVNSISPSNVWTPLFDELASYEADPDAMIQRCTNSQATWLGHYFSAEYLVLGRPGPEVIGRFGTTDEFGEACLFLAMSGSFCTGIDLKLSGGAELGYGDKNQWKHLIDNQS